MHQLIITTTASGREIRQAMNSLLKSKAINSGYKINYMKKYVLDKNNAIQTINIQSLIIIPGAKRDQLGVNLLDKFLKEREILEK